MPVHRRVTPSIKFAGIHLYTWVERRTVKVKCFAQEHNTMSPARAPTWTASSGDKHTNHEATAPPTTITKMQNPSDTPWLACESAVRLSLPALVSTLKKIYYETGHAEAHGIAVTIWKFERKNS